MRFDTKIQIYKQELVDDGMAGYEYKDVLFKEVYANKTYLASKYCLEVFGYASTTAITVIFRHDIKLDKKEKYKVKIGEIFYNILDIKVFKNKTRMFLEVMDND